MLFNTISFAIFLPVVYAFYWLLSKKKLRYQNLLLLVASYYFYACWDYRFLALLMFSTALDYFTGIKIHTAPTVKKKKYWLALSVCINLGFLGIFKYYNFFAASFAEGLAHLGIKVNFFSLNVILPVGISFYTFHGLSYVFDIYNSKIKPVRDFIEYSVFVCFFPLLVAGPIERATHLLPQIQKKREFDYARSVDGLRQILWGLFKKIVIADNCAVFVNYAFKYTPAYHGSTLFIGILLFAFQIYCDFSGYSDIALGTARLFGIDLLRNFAFPYFSRDIAEFWRRWHISLSSWFRDYVYIPLGGSRGGTWMSIRNTFIIFILSGFWHGANWTFIVWGGLNALYFLPVMLLNRNRINLLTVAHGKYLPTFREFMSIIITFGLTLFAWVFFRANDLHHAFTYLSLIFSDSFFTIPQFRAVSLYIFLIVFVIIEWLGREHQYALANFGFNWHKSIRWAFYYCLVASIFLFSGAEQQFIYFQF